MTDPIGHHSVAAAHPSEYGFAFAARGAVLLAHRDMSLPAVPVTDGTADEILARLGKITREAAGQRTRRGRRDRPMVCGMIPFDPDEPADLFITERPVRVPRPRPAGPVASAPELVAGPLPQDPGHREAVAVPRRPSVAGDAAAQQALLHDPAARGFHRHALDHAQRALQGRTGCLAVPARPSVVATDATWHLATRLTGRLRRDTSALHTALALHRGPAAGGTPTDAALSLIRELEPCRRGPYAGLVGWTAAAGHGQWVPVVRCALITQARARLYAAAHLTLGSTVEGAHARTTAGFATLRAALAGAETQTPCPVSAGTPWLPEAA
ncbi:hypothetical protein GCM10011374_10190 [Kocuria dechangensis]|uniref:Chorismate-utilising enzyme C-terminal domain-containing protein n=1 Tax=Kocuria dechangensis TaxID=1176249 RepID=A0A917GKL1_9MICC|nr:chorismate-binding protein [Kocuria dechangensis]GGG49654.1 hypothetical protein GCM10011374_10190 [Kocuria dechangensis]